MCWGDLMSLQSAQPADCIYKSRCAADSPQEERMHEHGCQERQPWQLQAISNRSLLHISILHATAVQSHWRFKRGPGPIASSRSACALIMSLQRTTQLCAARPALTIPHCGGIRHTQTRAEGNEPAGVSVMSLERIRRLYASQPSIPFCTVGNTPHPDMSRGR